MTAPNSNVQNVEIITVGMAELKVSKAPNIIRTVLGSCIGVALYDPEAKVGGVLHLMLPDSSGLRTNRAKYADTGISDLIEAVLKAGANRSRLYARLAGGADMFSKLGGKVRKIGDQNREASLLYLKKEDIKVRARDTGGTRGRKMTFDLATGKIIITVFGEDMDREM